MSRMPGMTWVTRALSILNLSKNDWPAHSHHNENFSFNQLTIQISQKLNIIHKGHGFLAKPLGKCLLYLKNVRFSLGLAGQF